MSERADLAKNLRILIKKAGYKSPEEFAYANDLGKSTVYRILRRKADPRLSTLAAIAKKLEVDFIQLFQGKGKR